MLGFTVREFEGFAPEDFDAFQEKKWRSNRFNLERMRVRDKLLLLGERLVEREPGLAEGLTREVSGHTPSIFNNHQVEALWLCFRRPEPEHRDLLAALEQVRPLSESVRDPQPLHKEVLVGVRIDEQGLEVGLRLHAHAWVDAQNLLVRLEDDEERAEWSRLLAGFTDVEGTEAHVLEQPLTGEGSPDDGGVQGLRGLLDGGDGWLVARRLFPRDDERLAVEGCVELLGELLQRLLPLRRFVAWSEDTDRLDLAGRLAERRARAAELAAAPVQTPTAPTEPIRPVRPQAPPPAEPSPHPPQEPIPEADRRPEWARFTPPARQPRQPRGERPERAEPPAIGEEQPPPGWEPPPDLKPREERRLPPPPPNWQPRPDRRDPQQAPGGPPQGGQPREERRLPPPPPNWQPRGARPDGPPNGARPPRGERPPRRDDRRRDDRRRDDRGRDDRGRGPGRAYTVGPTEARTPPKPQSLTPTDGPIEAQCTAKVTEGLFRGQIGTVLDIDGKGNAQVLIHQRTVRVPSEHLQRME